MTHMLRPALRESLEKHKELRRKIAAHFRWFCHLTPVENLPSIRGIGLKPQKDKPADPVVMEFMGEDAASITCLTPLGAEKPPPPVREPPFVCLAVDHLSLPARIGVDWSYDYAWSLAEELRRIDSKAAIEDIFVSSLVRTGSLVTYDLIPAHSLRICLPTSMPINPSAWPMLTDTVEQPLKIDRW